ncbi:hypothetical protein KKE87_04185 [Patescibacteria group bacterium]|nr:hypothetical protein [Patescibacteria group bacterium]
MVRNALYEEIDRLKVEIAKKDAEIAKKDAEFAKKDAEFTVNAKMLARQTDLA